MAQLLAQGPKPDDTWRRSLPADESVVLGRAAGDWSVPWDAWLSRHHVEVTWNAGGFLSVRRLP